MQICPLLYLYITTHILLFYYHHHPIPHWGCPCPLVRNAGKCSLKSKNDLTSKLEYCFQADMWTSTPIILQELFSRNNSPAAGNDGSRSPHIFILPRLRSTDIDTEIGPTTCVCLANAVIFSTFALISMPERVTCLKK